MQGAKGFSHIFFLSYFHPASGFRLLERSFVDGSRERGIFSIRHINRPDPIGISLIEVVSAGGNTARMHEVDLLGGTPPPDIKPYVRRFDHRDDARSGWADA